METIKVILLFFRLILITLILLVHLSCQISYADVFPTGHTRSLRFAFLTDLHVSPGNENEKALYKIVQEINQETYDYVVVTGDLTNTGSNAELLSVRSILADLTVPLLIIPGNHETNWSESAGQKFNELWGSDHFMHKACGYLLAGLNTGPFMKMGDGHVKEEDLKWLRDSMEKQSGSAEQLIFFSHYPLTDGLDNWDKVTEILKANDCKAVFCGHGHQLKLFNFDGIPGIMGRPLELRSIKRFGYNLVTIRNDSLIIEEKIVGEPDPVLFSAISLITPHEVLKLPVSPKPDYTVNALFPLVKKTSEFTDTASIFTGACLIGDTLLIYGNSLGWIKAIHLKKKSVHWENRLNGPVYSTPVYSSGIVVTGSIDGIIYGFSPVDGREVWKVTTGRPVLSEALAEGDYIYIGGGDSAFYKLDVQTGRIIWHYDEIGGAIQGKPASSGRYIVFGAWDRHLYCLDKKSGRLVWKWNNGKSQILFSPGNIVPVISHRKVFLVAPDRFATALDLKTGQQIWRTNAHMVRESMGISPNSKEVYAKLMYDSVVAFSAVSEHAQTLWKAHAGLGYDHNPCPVVSQKHQVLLANKNGLLVSVDPRTGQIRWKYKAGNSSINKITIQTRDTLWITLTEGKIIALTYPL